MLLDRHTFAKELPLGEQQAVLDRLPVPLGFTEKERQNPTSILDATFGRDWFVVHTNFIPLHHAVAQELGVRLPLITTDAQLASTVEAELFYRTVDRRPETPLKRTEIRDFIEACL